MERSRPPVDRWTWPVWLLALAAPLSVAASGVALGLLLATALARAVERRGQVPLPPFAVARLLLAVFAVHAAATALATPSRWDKLVDELWIDSLLVAVPLVIGTRREVAGKAITVMLAVGALVAIYGTVQHWTGIDLVRDRLTNGVAPGRHIANGFFNHHLTYGGSVLVMWTLAAAATAQYGFGRNRRALASWLALVCTSSGLFFSFARSAQLGAVAAAALLVTTLSTRQRWTALLCAAAVAALAPLSAGFRARFGDLLALETEETRLNLWRSAWHGLLERPWTGWGPGNFDRLLQAHEVEGYYEVRAHAHSDFLMCWMNSGIFGLLAWLALMVTVTVLLWRGRRRAGPWTWIPTAGVALQLAFLVAGLFQVYQSDDEVEFALLLVLGAGLALVRGPARAPDED